MYCNLGNAAIIKFGILEVLAQDVTMASAAPGEAVLMPSVPIPPLSTKSSGTAPTAPPAPATPEMRGL